MASYEDAALAGAKAAKLTSAAVARLGYTGVANLAGVAIGKKGESPADFFYEAVRGIVAGRLKDDEGAAAQLALETKLKAALATDVSLKDVTFTISGKIVDLTTAAKVVSLGTS